MSLETQLKQLEERLNAVDVKVQNVETTGILLLAGVTVILLFITCWLAL